MIQPRWLLRSLINAIHDMQLAENGGAVGIRDEGLLESALARPLNQFSNGNDDLHQLAAGYAYGICRNHPFVDGNKRTAFLAALVFLDINGLELVADEISATRVMLDLASGSIDEDVFADWLKRNTRRG